MPDQHTAVKHSDQGSCFKPRKEGRSLPPAQQSFLGPGAAGRVAPAAHPLVSQCCRLWGCASTCRPCASCMAPHKSGLGRAEDPAQTRRLSAVSNSTMLYWSAGQSSCCCENPSAGLSLHACLDHGRGHGVILSCMPELESMCPSSVLTSDGGPPAYAHATQGSVGVLT